MKKILPHTYGHLNNPLVIKQDGIKLEIHLDKIIEGLVDCNYGIHRILSMLLDIKESEAVKAKKMGYENDYAIAMEAHGYLKEAIKLWNAY